MDTRTNAAGIDLGKESFVLSYPDPDQAARKWPTVAIKYKDPGWHDLLISSLAPDAVVVAEPTGMNLIAPIAAVIRAFTTASLYLVNHHTTGRVRDEHISRTKNDDLDARALALIASWVNTPAQPRSIRPYAHADEEATAVLRLYIDHHRRLTKQRVATINRLHALGFGMWPNLSFSLNTWLNAIHDHDAITPADLHALVARPPAGVDMRRFRHIEALAAKLPDLHIHPARRAAAQSLAADLPSLETQIADNLTIIQHLIDQPPFADVTAIWRTVPAASEIAIASLHAATHGHIETYERDEFKAAVGSNPQGKSSGKSSKSKQSRSGYSPAAANLHLWTMALIGMEENPVARYYQQTSSPRALAAARNKFARILWTLAVRKEPCSWGD